MAASALLKKGPDDDRGTLFQCSFSKKACDMERSKKTLGLKKIARGVFTKLPSYSHRDLLRDTGWVLFTR